MPATVFNQGLQMQAAGAGAFCARNDLVILLWSANVTPAASDNPSGTTNAYYGASTSLFTGYANISINPANWVFTGTAPYYATYPLASFTSSAGSQNVYVYGYAVMQTTTGLWYLAERFVGTSYPAHIVNNGDVVGVNFEAIFQSP